MANRTAPSDELLDALLERAGKGSTVFTLVVPSTPHGLAWATNLHPGAVDAARNMQSALTRLREAGLEVKDAQLGHPDPLAAVAEAVRHERFDEIVVCTPPRRLSKQVNLDLPNRLELLMGLPVHHVVASRPATQTLPGPHSADRCVPLDS